jgi:hypothetical protein
MKPINILSNSTYNIFIRLDEHTVYDYFNHHDPAPLYKRQLGHEFEHYIYNSLLTSKRDAVINYKLICLEHADKRFIEPVTKAIQAHFNQKKYLKQEEFRKFKKRTFTLLFISIAIVLTLQLMLPYFISWVGENMSTSLHSILDVFSWVIMWKPIDRLIFHWNPYLKEIHLVDRLANATIVIIEKNKTLGKEKQKIS